MRNCFRHSMSKKQTSLLLKTCLKCCGCCYSSECYFMQSSWWTVCTILSTIVHSIQIWKLLEGADLTLSRLVFSTVSPQTVAPRSPQESFTNLKWKHPQVRQKGVRVDSLSSGITTSQIQIPAPLAGWSQASSSLCFRFLCGHMGILIIPNSLGHCED